MSQPKKTKIRTAAAAALAPLKADNTFKEIFPNRIEQYQTQNLPCLSVFFGDETPTAHSVNGRQYRREVELQCQAVFAGNSGLDALFDDAQEKLETVLLQSTFGGEIQAIELTQIQNELLGETATEAIGRLTVTFKITYTN